MTIMARQTARKSIPRKNPVNLIKLPAAASTPITKNTSHNQTSASSSRSRQDAFNAQSETLRKRHRFKPGTRALQEIRYFQKSTHLLIPKLPFCRVVRELLIRELGGNGYRIQSQALEALHTAVEAFLIRFLADANRCAVHANRVTLMVKDLLLVLELKHDDMKTT